MSTPDQPETPPLTRRRIREIRETGANTVPSAEDIAAHAETTEEKRVETALEQERLDNDARDLEAVAEPSPDAVQPEPEVEPEVEPEAEVEPEPEPAAWQPVAASPLPAGVAPEASPDLGVAPLTRRQAREHERIRTASVPIITPELDAAQHPADDVDAPVAPVDPPAEEASPKSAPREIIAEVPGSSTASERPTPAVVDPNLGSGLLVGDLPPVDLPPSFDQLITRNPSASGSSSTPNALILSQAPSAAPFSAPVTATGEVIITGTFDLPEGLGSVGHAPGIHDGKDVDAVLVDGELPAASSPTPIAASAAISTVRSSDEIIRPPAPEKGGRVVLALVITTGALGLVLIGTLVLAIATGAI